MNSKQYNLIKSAYINKKAEPSWLDYYRTYQRLGDQLASGVNPASLEQQVRLPNVPNGLTEDKLKDAFLTGLKGKDPKMAPMAFLNNAKPTWASFGRQFAANFMPIAGVGLGAAGGYGVTHAATKGLGMHDSNSGFVRGLGTALDLAGLGAGLYFGHGLGRYGAGRLLSGASKANVGKYLSAPKPVAEFNSPNAKLYAKSIDEANLASLIQRW